MDSKGIMDKSDALVSLEPNSNWIVRGEEIEWFSPDITQPSDSAIASEITRLQTEYDALVYSRNRRADYPDMGTQFNKIYDDGIDKWKTEMVDPVKIKHPKPE